MHDYEVFDVGDPAFQRGAMQRGARSAYKTHADAERSNTVGHHPMWYSGRHWDNEWLIGEVHGPRCGEALRHRAQHVRQRSAKFAEQHAGAVRRGLGLPAHPGRWRQPVDVAFTGSALQELLAR